MTARMAVTLQSVLDAIDKACDRPEAQFGDTPGWTAGEYGRQAKKALEANSTRQAIPFLKMACETELLAAAGTAFHDAYTLLLVWLDQLVEISNCAECGSAIGRACTIFNRTGAAVAREWVHERRLTEGAGLTIMM